MGYLICDKCEGYYELQHGESPEDFILKCNCGGKLKFYNSFDEYYNSNTVDTLDLQDILLNDPEGAKRAHVAYLLGETKDSKYIDVLCEATKDKDGNVRRLSASALGKIGNIRAEDVLIELLKDPKPQVRQYAVKAIGKIKSVKAVEHLRNMKNDKNRYVVQEVELLLSTFVNDNNLLEQKNRNRLIGINFKRNIAKEVYSSDFRENQNHFFKFFNEHQNQNIIADAPTGSGKSLIAIQIAINLERPGTVFIVTPTKDLMKQYERDFGHLEDVMLLAGKNEYNCNDFDGFSADQCTHTKKTPCKHHYSKTKDSCEYSKKINTFMDYKVVITNYHMMLALINIREALEWDSSLIIWDESHKFIENNVKFRSLFNNI
jgi:Rad3-related DNA helicase